MAAASSGGRDSPPSSGEFTPSGQTGGETNSAPVHAVLTPASHTASASTHVATNHVDAECTEGGADRGDQEILRERVNALLARYGRNEVLGGASEELNSVPASGVGARLSHQSDPQGGSSSSSVNLNDSTSDLEWEEDMPDGAKSEDSALLNELRQAVAVNMAIIESDTKALNAMDPAGPVLHRGPGVAEEDIPGYDDELDLDDFNNSSRYPSLFPVQETSPDTLSVITEHTEPDEDSLRLDSINRLSPDTTSDNTSSTPVTTPRVISLVVDETEGTPKATSPVDHTHESFEFDMNNEKMKERLEMQAKYYDLKMLPTSTQESRVREWTQNNMPPMQRRDTITQMAEDSMEDSELDFSDVLQENFKYLDDDDAKELARDISELKIQPSKPVSSDKDHTYLHTLKNYSIQKQRDLEERKRYEEDQKKNQSPENVYSRDKLRKVESKKSKTTTNKVQTTETLYSREILRENPGRRNLKERQEESKNLLSVPGMEDKAVDESPCASVSDLQKMFDKPLPFQSGSFRTISSRNSSASEDEESNTSGAVVEAREIDVDTMAIKATLVEGSVVEHEKPASKTAFSEDLKCSTEQEKSIRRDSIITEMEIVDDKGNSIGHVTTDAEEVSKQEEKLEELRSTITFALRKLSEDSIDDDFVHQAQAMKASKSTAEGPTEDWEREADFGSYADEPKPTREEVVGIMRELLVKGSPRTRGDGLSSRSLSEEELQVQLALAEENEDEDDGETGGGRVKLKHVGGSAGNKGTNPFAVTPDIPNTKHTTIKNKIPDKLEDQKFEKSFEYDEIYTTLNGQIYKLRKTVNIDEIEKAKICSDKCLDTENHLDIDQDEYVVIGPEESKDTHPEHDELLSSLSHTSDMSMNSLSKLVANTIDLIQMPFQHMIKQPYVTIGQVEHNSEYIDTNHLESNQITSSIESTDSQNIFEADTKENIRVVGPSTTKEDKKESHQVTELQEPELNDLRTIDTVTPSPETDMLDDTFSEKAENIAAQPTTQMPSRHKFDYGVFRSGMYTKWYVPKSWANCPDSTAQISGVERDADNLHDDSHTPFADMHFENVSTERAESTQTNSDRKVLIIAVSKDHTTHSVPAKDEYQTDKVQQISEQASQTNVRNQNIEISFNAKLSSVIDDKGSDNSHLNHSLDGSDTDILFEDNIVPVQSDRSKHKEMDQKSCFLSDFSYPRHDVGLEYQRDADVDLPGSNVNQVDPYKNIAGILLKVITEADDNDCEESDGESSMSSISEPETTYVSHKFAAMDRFTVPLNMPLQRVDPDGEESSTKSESDEEQISGDKHKNHTGNVSFSDKELTDDCDDIRNGAVAHVVSNDNQQNAEYNENDIEIQPMIVGHMKPTRIAAIVRHFQRYDPVDECNSIDDTENTDSAKCEIDSDKYDHLVSILGVTGAAHNVDCSELQEYETDESDSDSVVFIHSEIAPTKVDHSHKHIRMSNAVTFMDAKEELPSNISHPHDTTDTSVTCDQESSSDEEIVPTLVNKSKYTKMIEVAKYLQTNIDSNDSLSDISDSDDLSEGHEDLNDIKRRNFGNLISVLSQVRSGSKGNTKKLESDEDSSDTDSTISDETVEQVCIAQDVNLRPLETYFHMDREVQKDLHDSSQINLNHTVLPALYDPDNCLDAEIQPIRSDRDSQRRMKVIAKILRCGTNSDEGDSASSDEDSVNDSASWDEGSSDHTQGISDGKTRKLDHLVSILSHTNSLTPKHEHELPSSDSSESDQDSTICDETVEQVFVDRDVNMKPLETYFHLDGEVKLFHQDMYTSPKIKFNHAVLPIGSEKKLALPDSESCLDAEIQPTRSDRGSQRRMKVIAKILRHGTDGDEGDSASSDEDSAGDFAVSDEGSSDNTQSISNGKAGGRQFEHLISILTQASSTSPRYSQGSPSSDNSDSDHDCTVSECKLQAVSIDRDIRIWSPETHLTTSKPDIIESHDPNSVQIHLKSNAENKQTNEYLDPFAQINGQAASEDTLDSGTSFHSRRTEMVSFRTEIQQPALAQSLPDVLSKCQNGGNNISDSGGFMESEILPTTIDHHIKMKKFARLLRKDNPDSDSDSDSESSGEEGRDQSSSGHEVFRSKRFEHLINVLNRFPNSTPTRVLAPEETISSESEAESTGSDDQIKQICIDRNVTKGSLLSSEINKGANSMKNIPVIIKSDRDLETISLHHNDSDITVADMIVQVSGQKTKERDADTIVPTNVRNEKMSRMNTITHLLFKAENSGRHPCGLESNEPNKTNHNDENIDVHSREKFDIKRFDSVVSVLQKYDRLINIQTLKHGNPDSSGCELEIEQEHTKIIPAKVTKKDVDLDQITHYLADYHDVQSKMKTASQIETNSNDIMQRSVEDKKIKRVGWILRKGELHVDDETNLTSTKVEGTKLSKSTSDQYVSATMLQESKKSNNDFAGKINRKWRSKHLENEADNSNLKIAEPVSAQTKVNERSISYYSRCNLKAEERKSINETPVTGPYRSWALGCRSDSHEQKSSSYGISIDATNVDHHAQTTGNVIGGKVTLYRYKEAPSDNLTPRKMHRSWALGQTDSSLIEQKGEDNEMCSAPMITSMSKTCLKKPQNGTAQGGNGHKNSSKKHVRFSDDYITRVKEDWWNDITLSEPKQDDMTKNSKFSMNLAAEQDVSSPYRKETNSRTSVRKSWALGTCGMDAADCPTSSTQLMNTTTKVHRSWALMDDLTGSDTFKRHTSNERPGILKKVAGLKSESDSGRCEAHLDTKLKSEPVPSTQSTGKSKSRHVSFLLNDVDKHQHYQSVSVTKLARDPEQEVKHEETSSSVSSNEFNASSIGKLHYIRQTKHSKFHDINDEDKNQGIQNTPTSFVSDDSWMCAQNDTHVCESGAVSRESVGTQSSTSQPRTSNTQKLDIPKSHRSWALMQAEAHKSEFSTSPCKEAQCEDETHMLPKYFDFNSSSLNVKTKLTMKTQVADALTTSSQISKILLSPDHFKGRQILGSYEANKRIIKNKSPSSTSGHVYKSWALMKSEPLESVPDRNQSIASVSVQPSHVHKSWVLLKDIQSADTQGTNSPIRHKNSPNCDMDDTDSSNYTKVPKPTGHCPSSEKICKVSDSLLMKKPQRATCSVRSAVTDYSPINTESLSQTTYKTQVHSHHEDVQEKQISMTSSISNMQSQPCQIEMTAENPVETKRKLVVLQRGESKRYKDRKRRHSFDLPAIKVTDDSSTDSEPQRRQSYGGERKEHFDTVNHPGYESCIVTSTPRENQSDTSEEQYSIDMDDISDVPRLRLKHGYNVSIPQNKDLEVSQISVESDSNITVSSLSNPHLLSAPIAEVEDMSEEDSQTEEEVDEPACVQIIHEKVETVASFPMMEMLFEQKPVESANFSNNVVEEDVNIKGNFPSDIESKSYPFSDGDGAVGCNQSNEPDAKHTISQDTEIFLDKHAPIPLKQESSFHLDGSITTSVSLDFTNTVTMSQSSSCTDSGEILHQDRQSNNWSHENFSNNNSSGYLETERLSDDLWSIVEGYNFTNNFENMSNNSQKNDSDDMTLSEESLQEYVKIDGNSSSNRCKKSKRPVGDANRDKSLSSYGYTPRYVKNTSSRKTRQTYPKSREATFLDCNEDDQGYTEKLAYHPSMSGLDDSFKYIDDDGDTQPNNDSRTNRKQYRIPKLKLKSLEMENNDTSVRNQKADQKGRYTYYTSTQGAPIHTEQMAGHAGTGVSICHNMSDTNLLAQGEDIPKFRLIPCDEDEVPYSSFTQTIHSHKYDDEDGLCLSPELSPTDHQVGALYADARGGFHVLRYRSTPLHPSEDTAENAAQPGLIVVHPATPAITDPLIAPHSPPITNSYVNHFFSLPTSPLATNRSHLSIEEILGEGLEAIPEEDEEMLENPTVYSKLQQSSQGQSSVEENYGLLDANCRMRWAENRSLSDPTGISLSSVRDDHSFQMPSRRAFYHRSLSLDSSSQSNCERSDVSSHSSVLTYVDTKVWDEEFTYHRENSTAFDYIPPCEVPPHVGSELSPVDPHLTRKDYVANQACPVSRVCSTSSVCSTPVVTIASSSGGRVEPNKVMFDVTVGGATNPGGTSCLDSTLPSSPTPVSTPPQGGSLHH